MDKSLSPPISITGDGSGVDDLSSWSSWSALKENRTRNRKRVAVALAVRLSASVDSIPYMDNDFLSSMGSLNNFPDFGETEEDGSVNNILDALGGGQRTSSIAGLSAGGVTLDSLDHEHHNPNNQINQYNQNIQSIHYQKHQHHNNHHHHNQVQFQEGIDESINEIDGMTRELSILSTPGINKRSPVVGLGMTMTDCESSGVGSGTSAHSSASPTGSSIPGNSSHNEEYEHTYEQLDPYFSPPISHTKSQPIVSLGGNGRFSSRSSSLRSWGRSAVNMDRESTNGSSFIPFLQQALLSRYRGMLEEYLLAPGWYRTHMGATELDEICPIVYQVLPSDKNIYGTTSSSKKSLLNSSLDLRHGNVPHENLRPILPHQIFSKTSEDDMSRAFWLEGESGSGKSLLSLKLVQEWVAYHTYNYTSSPLNTRIGEFQVVFYVPLKEVRGSLSRFLVKELIPKRSVASRIKVSTLWKCLNNLGSSLLLILDGLDDITDEDLMKEIENLLNGQMFPQAMILLTSTPRLSSPVLSSQNNNNNNNSSNVNTNGNNNGSNTRRSKGGDGIPGNVRKYLVSGMDWTQIQFCVRRYFTGRKFGNEGRMSEILSDRDDLCALAANPFMAVLLCSVFEEVGDIPCSNAELFSTLIRSLIAQNGLIKSSDTSTTSSYSTKETLIPPKYQKILQDFGKLALTKLNKERVSYTESEVIEFCGNLDILKTGLLSKPKGVFLKKKSSSSNKKSSSILSLLHPSLNSFLASYYLAVTINYPNILRRELELLPGLEKLQQNQVRLNSNPFLVLHHLMELLQNKSASVFLTMNLLDISLNYLLALLRAGGFYESNLRAVCGIMRSLKHVTISVGSEWVSEWKQVISSVHCPFESAEIVIRPGYSMSRIIEGLCYNESVASVKFSSIPGSDWNPVEVNLICGQLLRLLCEKKLRCLEIVMTCLEDKEHNRFQAVVDALCLALSKGSPLKKLVLDMDLTSSQVIQLVSFIKCHESLEVLHLPHLGCGPEGFRALADLLRDKPLVSLSLQGSWRSNSLEEESQVILEPFPLMNPFLNSGPLSGSRLAGGTGFSSLPRGGNGSIKSPSIRRKKGSLHGHHQNHHNPNNFNHPGNIGSHTRLPLVTSSSGSSSSTNVIASPVLNGLNENDKRNSDSVLFQRNFLPLPICDRENHEVDGFHEIFSVLRSPGPIYLTSLNLSKCVMNWEDVICLGETIRKMTCLDSLRMEGMKLCDVLPVLLGLQENRSLKMLDLSSPHVVMGDDALQLAANSLAKNQSLRLLAIQGWTLYIEEERSLDSLETLFSSSTLQDLDLSSLRIHVNFNNSNRSKSPLPGTPTPTPASKSSSTMLRKSSKESSGLGGLGGSLKHKASQLLGSTSSLKGKGHCPELGFLRLGGIQMELQKKQLLKSPDVFEFLLPLIDKGKITHLDISLDKNEGPLGTLNHLDDKAVLKTFKLIGQHLPRLQTLVIKHWKVRLSSEKVCKELGKSLSNLHQLCGLNMDFCNVTTETHGGNSSSSSSSVIKRIDSVLIGSLLSNLKSLTEFSWANFDMGQMTGLAKTLCDNPCLSGKLLVKLEGISLPGIKTLIAAASGVKGNAASGVGIEYIGNHSVIVSKSKERNEHLMYKIKRLLE